MRKRSSHIHHACHQRSLPGLQVSRDSSVTLHTGSGKSLIFCVPMMPTTFPLISAPRNAAENTEWGHYYCPHRLRISANQTVPDSGRFAAVLPLFGRCSEIIFTGIDGQYDRQGKDHFQIQQKPTCKGFTCGGVFLANMFYVVHHYSKNAGFLQPGV